MVNFFLTHYNYEGNKKKRFLCTTKSWTQLVHPPTILPVENFWKWSKLIVFWWFMYRIVAYKDVHPLFIKKNKNFHVSFSQIFLNLLQRSWNNIKLKWVYILSLWAPDGTPGQNSKNNVLQSLQLWTPPLSYIIFTELCHANFYMFANLFFVNFEELLNY